MMKQKNIPWMGAIVESAFNTLPVLSGINFISIVIVLYANIQPQLAVLVPWMNIWVFLLVMCGVGVLLMSLVYVFVLPSLWSFRGRQMFQYESDLVKKIDTLQETVDKLIADKETE